MLHAVNKPGANLIETDGLFVPLIRTATLIEQERSPAPPKPEKPGLDHVGK